MAIRLTWNGNNIDFLIDSKGFEIRSIQEYAQNKSGSGLIEQINFYGMDEIELSVCLDQSTYRQFYTAFYSWIGLGKSFSFTMDSSNISDTTLDGSVSGAVIPLTSTSGLAIGDECLIIADGNEERELIEIQSISAGVSVTATSSLINTFVSGDVFRHSGYYPSLISLDKNFNPTKTGNYYNCKFKWAEDLS